MYKYIITFIFLYPAIMAFVWSIGGIYHQITRAKKSEFISGKVNTWPQVTIIVPCYNESAIIELSCQNLLNLDYPDYKVLFIDDGSIDDTSKKIKRYCRKNKRAKLESLPSNVGKANALNIAISKIDSPIVMIVDADTTLVNNSLKWFVIPFLNNPNIGAVTSNVFVANKSSLLCKIQAIEFTSIIGLIKRTQSLLNKVFTVSGCSTMYMKNVLLEVGGFSSNTVTEDIDITWKIQRRNYAICYASNAVAFICAPHKITQLIKQRKRWALGGWHLIKHHFSIFKNPKMLSLWVILFEFIISIIWSFCFIGVLIFTATKILFMGAIPELYDFFGWSFAFLSLTYIIQSLVSVLISSKFDTKLVNCFSSICWYPLFLFIFGPLLVVYTSFEGLFLNSENKWISPDR